MIAAATLSDNPSNPHDGDIVDILDLAVDGIFNVPKEAVHAALKELHEQFLTSIAAGSHNKDSHYVAAIPGAGATLCSISDAELAEHLEVCWT